MLGTTGFGSSIGWEVTWESLLEKPNIPDGAASGSSAAVSEIPYCFNIWCEIALAIKFAVAAD